MSFKEWIFLKILVNLSPSYPMMDLLFFWKEKTDGTNINLAFPPRNNLATEVMSF